ncbi:MAG: flagellar biosynthetic protein FliO [Alicyclobacillus sp.]|nr:flagellar biosynthetic protein FliO [Alicyclobacillus sp.]
MQDDSGRRTTPARLQQAGLCAASGWLISCGWAVQAVAFAADAQAPLGNPVAAAFKLMFSLALVVVLAVVTMKWLGRRMQAPEGGMVRVLGARQLAPNRSVQVIEVYGRHYLIGVGDQVTLLAELPGVAAGGTEALPRRVAATREDTGPRHHSSLSVPPVAASSFAAVLAGRLQALRTQSRRPPAGVGGSAPDTAEGGAVGEVPTAADPPAAKGPREEWPAS